MVDLNTSPYYNDYDPSKNFMRNLYKPSLAFQSREATQEGDYIQAQISRFADNILKEGSLVTGGQFVFDTAYRYIKISDLDPLANAVNVQNFLGTLITGDITGAQGIVYNVLDGTQNAANTKTLIVKYTRTANDTVSENVLAGETITANNGVRASVLSQSGAEVGTPYVFTIKEGVVYAKDYFINFPESTIIVDRYSNTPDAVVGFTIKEEIVTWIEDATLLDPANGSPNYTAPGADRLKITANLTVYPLNTATSPDFVQLFELKDGIIQSKADQTQYNVIRDYMARRTEDESGDYYVNGLNINLREHLNTGNNLGYLTQANGGNSSLLAVGVDPGLAYVKGYDIQTLVTKYVTTRKGLDYLNVSEQTISANYGNYVIVNELVGFFNTNWGAQILLYDTAQQRLSQKKWSTASQTGTQIGTARIKAIELLSGVPGTPTAQYKLYLYDITMTSGNFGNVKSVWMNNGGSNANASADTVLQSGIAVLNDTNFNAGIYDAANDYIRTIRNGSGAINTTTTFLKSFNVSIAINGTFSITSADSSEIFPYSVGSLNNTQKGNFLLCLNTATSITLAGTVTTTGTNSTITGSGTFFTRLNYGDKIEITGVAGTFFISSITSDTVMTVTGTPTAVTGASFKKAFYPGDIYDLTIKGCATGALRDVTINSPTSASFDLKETYSGTLSGILITRLNKNNAREIKKTLRRSRLVQIDTTSNATGPWNLGLSDVLKINYIRKKNGSSFATTTEGQLVTTDFVFDNGQRDTLYDSARIRLAPGAAITTGDRLLVSVDYFVPDFSLGVGYFSIDSYPIDDVNGSANVNAIQTQNIPIYKSPTTGISYDLRNSIDTRPVKTNTANDSTTIGGMSTNPSYPTTFQLPANGNLNTPAPNTNFIADYSFYQPRIDIVVMDSNGNIRVIEGVPGANPITPATPADAMQLAYIQIAPYPSLAPTYATSINRLDLSCNINKTVQKRYTMVNIGTLDQRITNLEYYQSLSLLEKATSDLKIPDVNGLDRFKNGFFVDPFNSHALGDLGNPDYYIAVDPVKGLIRPVFTSEVVDYDYVSGSGVTVANNVVILNYTETPIASQPYATNTRNCAGFFYNYAGVMSLSPSTDYWVETDRLPDLQISNSAAATSTQLTQTGGTGAGTIWNDWQTNWTGAPRSTGTTTTSNTASTSSGTGTTTTTTTNGSTTTTTTTTTQDIGDRVVDVSLIQTIRSRLVKINVTGLKPNTKVYPFFDGELVSAYCTPADVTTGNATGIEGANLITDALGKLSVIFRIPNDDTMRFRVGDRVFRVTDSFNNGDDAITSAEATYSAAGIVQQKQETFLTTTSVSTRTVVTTTTNQTRSSGFSSNTNTGSEPTRGGSKDPIAETLEIDLPINVTAFFVTGIDLYFKNKDPNYGVYVELRQVDSAGNITSTVIPYSTTYVPSANINLSDDGTVATHISFASPICLQNGYSYAFVVIPEANNPNSVIWTAKLGKTDITSGYNVSKQPYNGVLFVSSNNSSWSAIQDEDIKFTLYRAKFTPGATGTVSIANRSREFFTVTNPTGAWQNIGETVRGETRLTQASITGGSISTGQVITGSTSGASGTVTNISGSVYRVQGLTASSFQNETATVAYANGTSTGVSIVINNVTTPKGNLYKYIVNTQSDIHMILDATSGVFATGEQLRGATSNNLITVVSFDNMPYSTLDFESSTLEFADTAISWISKTTSNTSTIDSNFVSTIVGDNTEFVSERTIYGSTQENTVLGGKSIQTVASMSTNNEYVSPIIDLNRTFSIAVHNIINNDLSGETGISGGNAINKYISQKITLEQGQDAEDLKVYLTAYKPPSSNIRVYAKIINGQDSDTFANRAWFEMPLTNGSNSYSSITDKTDFIEFVYNIPDSMKTGPNGIVQTINSAGVTFTSYKFFQIKIVLIGQDSSQVPLVTDARAIALQI